MALNSPFHVRIEKPKHAFSTAMSEMRSWLDIHKIQPTEFKTAPTATGIAFDVGFREESQAGLFREAFDRL